MTSIPSFPQVSWAELGPHCQFRHTFSAFASTGKSDTWQGVKSALVKQSQGRQNRCISAGSSYVRFSCSYLVSTFWPKTSCTPSGKVCSLLALSRGSSTQVSLFLLPSIKMLAHAVRLKPDTISSLLWPSPLSMRLPARVQG
jgi:hypothetical protein